MREFKKTYSAAGSGRRSRPGLQPPAAAAMRTRSRPVTAVFVDAEGADPRGARRSRSAGGELARAGSPRTRSVRSRPDSARRERVEAPIGIACLDPGGLGAARERAPPASPLAIACPAAGSPWPARARQARSRSPASIRRGSRRSRTCRRSSVARGYLPRGPDHLGPRRARRGPIEIACLDPTRVAQITNLRRHAAARAWPARRPGPGPPRAHEGPRSRSPASIRRVARIANVPAPAPPLATVCPGARIALARGERIEAPIEIACLDPAGPCNQEPAPPAPPFAISCPRPGSPWPGEPARTGSKVAASRSRGSRGLRTRRRSRWPALAGSP
jgi:hypothetical protein